MDLLEQFRLRAFVTAFIGGPSGSGKSYMEYKTSELPEFTKMKQMTTRKKRDGEEFGREYFFIDKELMATLNESLFVSSTNDEHDYGTLPLFNPESINTVICDHSGFADFITKNNDEHKMDFNILFYSVIGLDFDPDIDPKRTEEREHRSANGYRAIFQDCDDIFVNNSDNYLPLKDFVTGIKANLKINPKFFARSLLSNKTLEILKHSEFILPVEEGYAIPYLLNQDEVDKCTQFILKNYFGVEDDTYYSPELDDSIEGLTKLIFGSDRYKIYKTSFKPSVEDLKVNEVISFKVYDFHQHFKDNIMKMRTMPYLPLLITDESMIFATTKKL